jgi:hypothetical protein
MEKLSETDGSQGAKSVNKQVPEENESPPEEE